MKKLIILVSLIILQIGLFASSLKACDFHFQAENQKTSYKVGDEIIITVSVTLTHRVCKVELEETQFIVSGMDIAGATNWVQLSDKVYARKFKIRITENPSSTIAKFSALRECEKDGGEGSIKFQVS